MFRDRGYLPHLELPGIVYFVTFRLADSLPESALIRYKTERDLLLRKKQNSGDISTASKRMALHRKLSELIDSFLDSGLGSCILADPRFAEIIAKAICHFDTVRYKLFAWCVMPNHVHVVFQLLNNHRLEKIMHSWKSYSSHQIAKIRGQTGRLWQREYYDHIIRDEHEFRNVIEYVNSNPIKANLDNWKWFGVNNSAIAEIL